MFLFVLLEFVWVRSRLNDQVFGGNHKCDWNSVKKKVECWNCEDDDLPFWEESDYAEEDHELNSHWPSEKFKHFSFHQFDFDFISSHLYLTWFRLIFTAKMIPKQQYRYVTTWGETRKRAGSRLPPAGGWWQRRLKRMILQSKLLQMICSCCTTTWANDNMVALLLQCSIYDLEWQLICWFLIRCRGGTGTSAAPYVAQPLPAGTELSDAHGFNETWNRICTELSFFPDVSQRWQMWQADRQIGILQTWKFAAFRCVSMRFDAFLMLLRGLPKVAWSRWAKPRTCPHRPPLKHLLRFPSRSIKCVKCMGRGVIKEANKNPSTDFGDNKALINWIPNSVHVSKNSKFNPNFHLTICPNIFKGRLNCHSNLAPKTQGLDQNGYKFPASVQRPWQQWLFQAAKNVEI